MIVKSLSRSQKDSIGQLIAYINREARDPDNGFCWNIMGLTEKAMEREFLSNAGLLTHAKGKNYYYHTILGFARESAPYLNKAIFHDIAAQYMKLYGKDCMAYGNVHMGDEVEHPHMHLAISANGIGQMQRHTHSKEAFYELKKAIQEYQELEYPFLFHSLVKHERSKALRNQHKGSRAAEDAIRQMQKRGQTADLKHLQQKIERSYNRAEGYDDFFARITKDEGLTTYTYRKRINGILYKGRKYRFLRLGITKEHFQDLGRRTQYYQRMKDLERMTPRRRKDRER